MHPHYSTDKLSVSDGNNTRLEKKINQCLSRKKKGTENLSLLEMTKSFFYIIFTILFISLRPLKILVKVSCNLLLLFYCIITHWLQVWYLILAFRNNIIYSTYSIFITLPWLGRPSCWTPLLTCKCVYIFFNLSNVRKLH